MDRRSAVTAPTAQPTGSIGVIAVRIGAQEFALDIMSIREIRGWSIETPLPRAPAHVRGMCELRGLVIPIIDLGAILGLKVIEPDSSSVVIVTEIHDGLAGLLVDGVSDLIDIDLCRLQATPATGSPDPGEVISGIFEIDGRILGLICLEKVIPAHLTDQERLAS